MKSEPALAQIYAASKDTIADIAVPTSLPDYSYMARPERSLSSEYCLHGNTQAMPDKARFDRGAFYFADESLLEGRPFL